MPDWKNNVYFVLVEPVESGNIGASARAIKNMGFKNLILVNGPDPLGDEAWWFAHSAEDILKKMKRARTLEEALKNMHVVVGTTRRKGKRRGKFRNMYSGMDELAEIASTRKVAVLFGREQKGLKTEETDTCSLLYYIPTGGEQPSLNLAQAVMVFAYELSRTEGPSSERPPRQPVVPFGKLDILFERLWYSIKLLEFSPRGNRNPETGTLRQMQSIIRRAQISRAELDMLHSFLGQIEEKLEPEDVRKAKIAEKKRKASKQGG
jgi:TrmH family RNA methyltransferase